MSDKKETISDIVKDMRKPKEGENGYLRCYLAEYADRIEEAWTEEKDNIERETCWRVADGVFDIVKKLEDCVLRDEGQGNAAAMREALCEILYVSEKYMKNCPHISGMIHTGIAARCRTALAVPPRNCDRYSHDEALEIWSSEKENGHNGCFDEWLYSTAENEGGNDEK